MPRSGKRKEHYLSCEQGLYYPNQGKLHESAAYALKDNAMFQHAQHWIQDEAQQSCRESLRSDEAPFNKKIKSEYQHASLATGPDSAINRIQNEAQRSCRESL